MNKKRGLVIILVTILAGIQTNHLVYAGSVAEASTIASADAGLINSLSLTPPNPASLPSKIELNPYENQRNLVNFEPAGGNPKNSRLLSKDEVREQKVDSALNWAQETIQNIDGIPVVYQGASQLISIGEGVNNFNKQLKKKYHLHFKGDDSGAVVTYKVKF